MEAYKHILVQLSSPETAEFPLKAALLVAGSFNGHIDAVHVHQEPSCILPVPVVASDMAGFVVSEVVSAEESAFAKTADKLRHVFEKFIEHHSVLPRTVPEPGIQRVTAEFREIFGCDDDVLAWCSRAADLTVLTRPGKEDSLSESYDSLNAVLMESGTAALVPPMGIASVIGKRIVVAWDGSEEAAKALSLAMPFLVKAEEVMILETATPNEEWADARAVAKRLAWHGIDSYIVKMPEFISVSAQGDEMIRQACGRFDLMVMGAYTQSYMRRWILGSITKYMLENADIALFMAH